MTDCSSTTRSVAAAPGVQVDAAALEAALQQPEADEAIGTALERLDRGADVPLALATAGAMVRSGVSGLAARLLHSLGAGDEIRPLLEQMRDYPSGETPWTDLADRYRSNCKALLAVRPRLRGIVGPDATVADDLHLFTTARGNAQIVRDGDDGTMRFVTRFADHVRNAAALRLGPIEDGVGFLLLGVPSVPLFDRLLALGLPSGYRPPIDIIEPEVSMLVMWLHLVDAAQALAGSRVNVFAGAEALSQYEAHRASSLWRREPTHTITSHRSDWNRPIVDDAFRERVCAAVAARRRELLAVQDSFYRDRTLESWAERFRRAGADEPPLRIAAFATRYSTVTQFVMRDLERTFERRGCAFTFVREPDDSCNDIDTWSTLASGPFDLLILLHHLRGQLADRVHRNVPFVCWIQDHMQRLCTKEAGRSVGPLDLVVGHGRGEMTSLYDYPADRFIATSNLTDLETYDDAPVPPADLDPYRCDVSFIGHGSATVEEIVDGLTGEKGPSFGSYLSRIVTMLRERLAERGWVALTDMLALMLDAEKATDGVDLTPAQRRHNVLPVVRTLFDRLVRHGTAHWVANWAEARGRRFRLFGRGWEEHPTLARYAGGEVPNGYELRCAYQATKVNLQVNGWTSLHQRLLDALASGGFVLSRFNPADFLREPMVALRDRMKSEGISRLEQLHARARGSREIRTLLDEIERLGGPLAAPSDDPRRRRENEVLRDAYDMPVELLDDAAQFAAIASLRDIPPRAASEIPGFAHTTFESEAALHRLLDRFVDDEPARCAIAAPMRRWVAQYGTYDRLVDEILDHFRALTEATPRAPAR